MVEILWSGVDRLVDRATSFEDLYRHGLHLLAARRWRSLGRELSEELVAGEQAAQLAIERAGVVLERVRAACRGTVVLLHGLEVATFYPDRALRNFGDLDLLVENAAAARQALLGAGFERLDTRAAPALLWPEQPVPVELFDRPTWIAGLQSPSTERLLSCAQPSATDIPGIGALPPGEHALIVAANAWAHKPLRRASDLIDVAALTAGADRRDLDALARAWGLQRLWTTTIDAADALISPGAHPTPPLRLWGRDVWELRAERLGERLLRRWLSPFWALPARSATRQMLATVAHDLRREPGESWREKAGRIRRGLTAS
jgi:Uncharacterised nucleotidyltransferase